MWSADEVNVLSQEKKQQVLTLGRLGWSLREIEEAVHVRRETASGYLNAFERGQTATSANYVLRAADSYESLPRTNRSFSPVMIDARTCPVHGHPRERAL